MLNVIYKPFMPSVIMLNVIMLNVIMQNVIMLNVIMLNVIMLNVIMLSVVVPCSVFAYNWWMRSEELALEESNKRMLHSRWLQLYLKILDKAGKARDRCFS